MPYNHHDTYELRKDGNNCVDKTVEANNSTVQATLKYLRNNRRYILSGPLTIGGGNGPAHNFHGCEPNVDSYELSIDYNRQGDYRLTGPSQIYQLRLTIPRYNLVGWLKRFLFGSEVPPSAIYPTYRWVAKGLPIGNGITEHSLAKTDGKIAVTIRCSTGKIKVWIVTYDDSGKQIPKTEPIELTATQARKFESDNSSPLNFALKVEGLGDKNSYNLAHPA